MCRGAGRGSRGGGCSHTRYDTRRKPCLTTTSSFFPRYVPHRAASRVASPTPRPSSSPLTPARLSASVIAIAPSSTAGVLAKPPWKRPCAVRIAERMTTSLSGTVSSSCRRVCGCSPRREIHALHHDTLIDGRLVNGTSSRLFVTADDFLRQERGDLERRGARPEAGVVAELLGEGVVDAWSSDHDHEAFAYALGLEQLYELREVLDVDVLLRDDLAHQDGVGIALERDADAILVSQIVTQKNIHVQHLTQLIELLEAEGVRERFVIVVGGPRINNAFAKELGYDAGFGPRTTPLEVASFLAQEVVRRHEEA